MISSVTPSPSYKKNTTILLVKFQTHGLSNNNNQILEFRSAKYSFICCVCVGNYLGPRCCFFPNTNFRETCLHFKQEQNFYIITFENLLKRLVLSHKYFIIQYLIIIFVSNRWLAFIPNLNWYPPKTVPFYLFCQLNFNKIYSTSVRLKLYL